MKKLLLAIIVLFLATPVWAGHRDVGDAHYVDCSCASSGGDGSTANCGDGGTNAFVKISQVNAHSFSAGEDVYFKNNTTCDRTGTVEMDARLRIDWAGYDTDNHVVIGCWESSGDFDCTDGSFTRPILDGEDDSSIFSGKSGALVEIDSSITGYVTIEDIDIRSAYWDNLVAGDSATETLQHIYVDNVYSSVSGNNSIQFWRVNTGAITNNRVWDCSARDGRNLAPSQACITVTALSGPSLGDRWGSATNITISGNVVYDAHNEGIDAIRGATNIIVEKNLVMDCNTVGIYFSNSSDNIARYNLIYGSTATDWDGDMSYGIAIQIEASTYCGGGTGCEDEGNGHQIYGNLIGGDDTYHLIRIISAAGDIQNTEVYNNTLIYPGDYCFSFAQENANWAGNKIYNNTCDRGNGAFFSTGDCDVVGTTWDSNNYDQTPGQSGNCRNDEIIGDPKINSSGVDWDNLTRESLTGQEFALLSGTASCPPEVGAVEDLGNTSDSCVTDITVACGFNNNNKTGTDFTASPIITDLYDRDSSPLTWCTGAWEWVNPPTTTPDASGFTGGAIISGGAKLE